MKNVYSFFCILKTINIYITPSCNLPHQKNYVNHLLNGKTSLHSFFYIGIINSMLNLYDYFFTLSDFIGIYAFHVNILRRTIFKRGNQLGSYCLIYQRDIKLCVELKTMYVIFILNDFWNF